MKDELDDLLKKGDLDAVLIVGPASHNAPMVYFTGPVHVDGFLVKRQGGPPVLFCLPMEREEAARTGLDTRMLDWGGFNQTAGGDPVELEVLILQHILTETGASGNVAVFGRMDAGHAFSVLQKLGQRMPKVQLQGRSDGRSPLSEARITKGPTEVERIRRVGKITVEIVAAVVDFLTSQRAEGNRLVTRTGEPVTVGDVKRRIRLMAAERGVEMPEGLIFSVGRDAGVPHSSGQDGDPISIGVPVLLDIYPCEAGGGYFYDFTRTWCLGHAPDEAAELHGLVLEAHRRALAALRPGVTARSIQQQTCDWFESHGHPTTRSDPKTLNGYVHSLGHGVGLDVHEPPAFRDAAEGEEELRAGMVFAIEPGLYYPERGLGMRIEDTVWLRPDGKPEILVDYPTDLELPLRPRRAPRKVGMRAAHRPLQQAQRAR